MEYLSAKDAADQWGCTVRWVQQCCKNGTIAGAVKFGKAWMIPQGAPKPAAFSAADPSAAPETKEKIRQQDGSRRMVPLLSMAFAPGECLESIQAIAEQNEQKIALAEYFYFTGQAERAAEMMELYHEADDPYLWYSAGLLYTVANLAQNCIQLAHLALERLWMRMCEDLESGAPKEQLALAVFTVTAVDVVMCASLTELPPLEEYISYLPEGLKVFSCYLLACDACLNGNYERALAIADIGTALYADRYLVASVYVCLAGIMALMAMKQTGEAKRRFADVWEISRRDDLLQPFGEHHRLLHGLVELFFKREHPADYARIVRITYRASDGWQKTHEADLHGQMPDSLTAMEFTIAMLANRGWTNKEIAAHMQFSVNTVKYYMSVIYQKLDIANRNELKQFLIR